MKQEESRVAVAVIGGGPVGIAVAAELKKRGIESLIIEKGAVTESIRRYPKRMKFFSTAENIEIAGIPFATSEVKANRNEALQYYRKVAAYFDLSFELHTEVQQVKRKEGIFEIHCNGGKLIRAQKVVIATGYFTKARKLGIEGEELPHVSHYYEEPYAHSFSKVAIVGGGNSAVEAALELYRHDVDVTMVLRGSDIKPTAKYWLVPDLKNRIKEGKIKVLKEHRALRIVPGKLLLQNAEGREVELPADAVYLLTGYLPDADFLKACGLQPEPDSLLLKHHPETLESEVDGLYLAGTVLAGVHTEKVFIENGRDHAIAIADHISASFEKGVPSPATEQ